MKVKELKELRTKKPIELLKMANEKRIEATQIASKMYAGKEKNLKKAGNLRKEVAQILTIKTEMEKTK